MVSFAKFLRNFAKLKVALSATFLAVRVTGFAKSKIFKIFRFCDFGKARFLSLRLKNLAFWYTFFLWPRRKMGVFNFLKNQRFFKNWKNFSKISSKFSKKLIWGTQIFALRAKFGKSAQFFANAKNWTYERTKNFRNFLRKFDFFEILRGSYYISAKVGKILVQRG